MALDGKWRVTASRHVHKDRWISLRADDCVTDDGVEIAPFYVLEYPDWVHVVALDDQDNVLLIRQYRHGQKDFSLEIPAGAIDPADADPLAAAARELREETGHAGEMSLVGVTTPTPRPTPTASTRSWSATRPASPTPPAIPQSGSSRSGRLSRPPWPRP